VPATKVPEANTSRELVNIRLIDVELDVDVEDKDGKPVQALPNDVETDVQDQRNVRGALTLSWSKLEEASS
jgi:hypothetical protein